MNISESGALVEGSLPGAEIGATFVVEWTCFHPLEPIGLPARLVRQTDSGFAVQFIEEAPFFRTLLKLARLEALR